MDKKWAYLYIVTGASLWGIIGNFFKSKYLIVNISSEPVIAAVIIVQEPTNKHLKNTLVSSKSS